MSLSLYFFIFMQCLPLWVAEKWRYTFSLPDIIPLIISWYYFEQYCKERSPKNYWLFVFKGIVLFVAMEYVFQHMLSFGIWSILGVSSMFLRDMLMVCVFLVFQKNLFGQYKGILNQGSGLCYKTLFYNLLLYFSFFVTFFVIHAKGLLSVPSAVFFSQLLTGMFAPVVMRAIILHIIMRFSALIRAVETPRVQNIFRDAVLLNVIMDNQYISFVSAESLMGTVIDLMIYAQLSNIHEGAEGTFSVSLATSFAIWVGVHFFVEFSLLSSWIIVPILLWNRMSTGHFPILANQYEPTKSMDHWVDKKWPEKRLGEGPAPGEVLSPESENAFSI